MPGTETERISSDRVALVHQLSIVGWLFLTGEFGFIFFQTERARSVDGTRFASAWDQRIEVLSFIVLPPNMIVLVPAAAVAALATHLAGSTRTAWLDALLRVTAGIAIVSVSVGTAAIVEVATRSGTLDLDAIFLRLGGISIATGVAWLCRIADLGIGTTTSTAGRG